MDGGADHRKYCLLIRLTMILIIDNYDSFTYNLYQYFCELGAPVRVQRHDQLQLADIEAMTPDHLVISPGPGTPDDAGISMAAIAHFAGKIPILGVCLGHQAIARVFGARIVRARQVMHGKTAVISHDNRGVFAGLPANVTMTRYHSLVVDPASLPPCLEVSAWSLRAGVTDEIMAIRHRSLPIEGVQFHPESVLSEQGHQLLANFLAR